MEWIDRPDFSERHATVVRAPANVVEACARNLDLGSSSIVRLLYLLRGMPASATRLDGMGRLGFRVLEDRPGSLVLGLIGRFWTPRGGLCRFDAADFAAFDEPGWAKATWSFQTTTLPGGRTRLTTETRVVCTDVRSRRRFRLYWTAIRPFSGLIRRIALRQIRNAAEARMN